MTNTIDGVYGSEQTECEVFTYEIDGGTWYTVAGSSNVNLTYEELENGVNVEMVNDADYFSWCCGIDSEEELIQAVEA